MNTKHILSAQCYNKNGKLLSSATNSYTKTHPLMAHFANKVGMPCKIYLHAEVAALLKAKDNKVYSLHVVRRTKAGTLRNAKPCAICMEAIRAFGVDKVFYSADNGCIEQLNMKG